MGYLDAKCIGTLWKKVTAFARLSVHQSLLHSFFLFFLFLFWFAIDPKGEKKRKGLRICTSDDYVSTNSTTLVQLLSD